MRPRLTQYSPGVSLQEEPSYDELMLIDEQQEILELAIGAYEVLLSL